MITGSRRMLSPRTNMSGKKRSCHRESCIASGTMTWNSRSTFPWRSATLRKRAVTTAASITSCATISPSSSFTAFIRNISSPFRPVTLMVSRDSRRSISSEGNCCPSSPRSCSLAATEFSDRLLALRETAQALTIRRAAASTMAPPLLTSLLRIWCMNACRPLPWCRSARRSHPCRSH